MHELTDMKTSLLSKENECETLRSQSARQTSLISSLQHRLQAAETREKSLHVKSEAMIKGLQHDKKHMEDKCKELCSKIRRLEHDCNAEEKHKDHARAALHELIRRLALCLGMDVCDGTQLTSECVLTKAGEVVGEMQRLRTKLAGTCETLTSAEAEMINIIKCKRLDVCSTLISIPRKSHKVFVYDDASRLSLAVSTGILNEKQFCQQER